MTALDAASSVTKGATILLLHLIADAVVCAFCHSSYYHPPLCVDHPEGYSCECGPGFRWNTQTCVALGLNSRLEFAEAEPVRYALLQDRSFPELHNFTIALWIRVESSDHPGTIMSYSHADHLDLLKITSGPTLRLKIQEEEIITGYKINASTWVHLAWTWSADGSYILFINDLVKKGKAPKADKVVPGGGRLVLGQGAEIQGKGYDTKFAFVGDIGGVNIWDHALSRQSIKEIASDCNLINCGNVVEWADFRSGTRGFVKLRWPSVIGGPQCNTATLANVRWDRTPAGDNATVMCPNQDRDANKIAYRECVRDDEANDGRWLDPIMDACISHAELTFKRAARDLVSSEADPSQGPAVLSLIEALDNQTAIVSYESILDIAVSAILDIFKPGKSMFGLDRDYDQRLYPSIEDTRNFAKSTCALVDHLIAERNSAGWGAMLPSGDQGIHLLASWQLFVDLIIRSNRLHVTRADITGGDQTVFTQSLPKLSLVVQHIARESHLTIQLPIPKVVVGEDAVDGQSTTEPVHIWFDKNITESQEIDVSLSWLNNPHLVPNHNVTPKVKDDNINSAFLHVVIEGKASPYDFSIVATFHYIHTFNISNPECVMLRVNNG
ncbi:hypothetical protein CAPTEDRAFT_221005 [Capitella teleta]|uniref:Uncharacterized protein n=1 Tax=Capitella teleta TaxID=283909 RepID=R7TT23_CAPTE|nr:hypothetical protein CAPTEDRAFT_221005 [Capitella teleta]|eukprot:ELT96762.1 hypothetical protein CAPTEDRAFT_221005 [Capitella teleta]